MRVETKVKRSTDATSIGVCAFGWADMIQGHWTETGERWGCQKIDEKYDDVIVTGSERVCQRYKKEWRSVEDTKGTV